MPVVIDGGVSESRRHPNLRVCLYGSIIVTLHADHGGIGRFSSSLQYRSLILDDRYRSQCQCGNLAPLRCRVTITNTISTTDHYILPVTLCQIRGRFSRCSCPL